MDFGFSNDPTGATLISINKKSKEIYLKEIVYAQGLTTSDIAARLLKQGKETLTIGDSVPSLDCYTSLSITMVLT